MRWRWSESCSVVSDSIRLRSPWNSPGQNTGVGSLSLLQGIFPTQESNPGLLHCGWFLYQLSYKRSSRRLEWVAYPFSRGSSPPRNQTGCSYIVGGFFTNWAMRETQEGGGGHPSSFVSISSRKNISWNFPFNFCVNSIFFQNFRRKNISQWKSPNRFYRLCSGCFQIMLLHRKWLQ